MPGQREKQQYNRNHKSRSKREKSHDVIIGRKEKTSKGDAGHLITEMINERRGQRLSTGKEKKDRSLRNG